MTPLPRSVDISGSLGSRKRLLWRFPGGPSGRRTLGRKAVRRVGLPGLGQPVPGCL